MTIHIANYKAQRQAFDLLLKEDCDKPILLFKGESGTGKSTLVRYYRDFIIRGIMPYCYIDFKETANNIIQVFYKIAEELGLDEEIDGFSNQPIIDIGNNVQAGMGNTINVNLNSSINEPRDEYRIRNTRFLLKAIKDSEKPFILLLDTYDYANTEIQNWLQGEFLNRVNKIKNLRVVVTGKEVPQSNEWDYCSEFRELYGVKEAEEWLPVIKAKGKVIPIEPQLIYLAGICHGLQGNPEAIVKVINGFPNSQ